MAEPSRTPFSIRALRFAVTIGLLSAVSQSYAASPYPREQVAEILRACCFQDESKKLFLFKEPVSVLLYDLSGLEENEREFFGFPIDSLQLRSGIDLSFTDLNKAEYQKTDSEVLIIILPPERSDIRANELDKIEQIYTGSQLSAGDKAPAFKDLLDKIYGTWLSNLIFGHTKPLILWRQSDEAVLGSLLLIRTLPHHRPDLRFVSVALLASLGYNRSLNSIQNTIFTHNEDDDRITELDYLVIKTLYQDKTKHSFSFEEVLKRLPTNVWPK